jgi:hypothetical protein
VPYSDDFEGYAVSSEAAYFSDQAGSWEIVASGDPGHGMVMRQAVRWSLSVSSFGMLFPST